MKPIRRFFDRHEELFSNGGRLARFEALYSAFRTLFFHPPGYTAGPPFVRDSLDLKRFMTFVIIALVPTTLFGMVNTGYQALVLQGQDPGLLPSFLTGAGVVLPIIAVSYGVGFFWEALFAFLRGKEISEGFLVSGLLFPLSLPPTIPLWQVAAGITFGIVIGKEIFGGTGRNILNPALTARAFVFFSYPVSMSGTRVWIAGGTSVDAVTQATPLALSADTGPIGQALIQHGYDFKTLFFGLHPGCIGETSAFLCFVGAGFLVLTGIASWRVILGGIIGLVTTSLTFMVLPGPPGTWFSAPPHFHLVAGGFALGISFMATDPVSGPGTDSGRWIYGFLIGFLTVLLRAVNPAFVEGVMLAILFMNVFAPLIDHVTLKMSVKKRIPNV